LLTDKNGNVIKLDTQGKNIEISAPETINITAKNLNINISENINTNNGIIQLIIVSLPKVPEFWCFFSNTKLLIFGDFYFSKKSLNSFIA